MDIRSFRALKKSTSLLAHKKVHAEEGCRSGRKSFQEIFIPPVADIIESSGHAVPADLLRRFAANYMSRSAHAHCGSRKRWMNQLDLEFDGRAGIHAQRRKKEKAARTDICRAQGVWLGMALSGYPLQVERQGEPGAGVGTPFASATHRMRGHAPDPPRPIGPFRIRDTCGSRWSLCILNYRSGRACGWGRPRNAHGSPLSGCVSGAAGVTMPPR